MANPYPVSMLLNRVNCACSILPSLGRRRRLDVEHLEREGDDAPA